MSLFPEFEPTFLHPVSTSLRRSWNRYLKSPKMCACAVCCLHLGFCHRDLDIGMTYGRSILCAGIFVLCALAPQGEWEKHVRRGEWCTLNRLGLERSPSLRQVRGRTALRCYLYSGLDWPLGNFPVRHSNFC